MLLDDKHANDSAAQFGEDSVDEKEQQIQTQNHYINQLESKLNEVEKHLEKEKELTKLLTSKLQQYENDEQIADRKKALESIIAPSFELDSQFEIQASEPRRSQRIKKISPNSMVKRVKSKKRKPKADPQFQYEVVFNKKNTMNLGSKEIEVEEETEKNEGKEEQIAEDIEEEEEGDDEVEVEEGAEEAEVDYKENEDSSSGIESSEYDTEKEEPEIMDLDKYSPNAKEYRQRNISKSHILQMLEPQKRDIVRAFFLCSDKSK